VVEPSTDKMLEFGYDKSSHSLGLKLLNVLSGLCGESYLIKSAAERPRNFWRKECHFVVKYAVAHGCQAFLCCCLCSNCKSASRRKKCNLAEVGFVGGYQWTQPGGLCPMLRIR